MSDLDDRLRTALANLGYAAEQRVRPAGSASVPAAGRRRRRAVRAATGALVLVLAGGAAATAGRLASDATPTAGSPACAPAYVTVTLETDAPDDRRRKLTAILADPRITSVRFESAAEVHARLKAQYGEAASVEFDFWHVTVRCADDFDALRVRLETVPIPALTWCTEQCDQSVTARPSASGR